MKTILAVLCFICAVPMGVSMLMAADYMIPYEGDPIDTYDEYLDICNHYDTIPQPDQLDLLRNIPLNHHDTLMSMKCIVQYVPYVAEPDTITNLKPTEDD